MARLVKSFIGGIASKVTGSYEEIDEESVPEEEEEKREGGKKTESNETEEEESGIVMKTGSGEETEKVSFSSEEEEEEEDTEEQQDDILHEQQTLITKPPSKCGSLSKWTNYLSGWQERYIVVRDGILSYYKSEYDTRFGCRGSVSLHKVKVSLHEFDELRFDIRAHDCTYFFRAGTSESKEEWMEIIEANKKYLIENGFGQTPITRQGSILSLAGMSQASTSSFKAGHNLHVKLSEMETYRDILCKQIDLLQLYFDGLVETTNGNSNGAVNSIETSTDSINEVPEKNFEQNGEDSAHYGQHSNPSSPLTHEYTRFSSNNNISSAQNSPITNRLSKKEHRRTGSDPFTFKLPNVHHSRSAHSRISVSGSSTLSSGIGSTELSHIDFKGEAITFKATTAGIIASLSHCIDLMSKREEYWKAKFEKEQERRRKAERAAHSAMNGPRVKAYEYSGPDFQEGPHSALNEEEFFDALEMAYQEDEIDAGNQRNVDPESTLTPGDDCSLVTRMKENTRIAHKSITGVVHHLTPEIDQKVDEYSKYVFEPVDTTTWVPVYEDGDMKVHRRELEEDGVVVDPLKAQCVVKGLSAYEMARYFFDPETKFEWEATIEKLHTLEVLAEDAIIFHCLHKRVWPSTQRESVFMSHHCTLSGEPRPTNMIGHTHMVCNFSIEHPSTPVTSKLIRAMFTASLVCQTITNRPINKGEESSLTRDDISCIMIYAANVNPGGWAPPSVVRTIAKRELTKFLKKFSSCCYNKYSNSPLTL